MPTSIARTEPTPNPDALKCVLSSELPSPPHAGLRSYASVQAALDGHDALAASLLGIHGITSVLIHPTWLTIVRAPRAPWGPIKAAVNRELSKHA